jgi:activator of HSP90 ATPase
MLAVTRRELIRGAVVAVGSGGLSAALVAAAAEDSGVSRSAASIHQEISFNANPRRVYLTLIGVSQFDRVVRLSGAMRSAGMEQRLSQHPTRMGQSEGEAFSLFGGYITGRHILLRSSELIVQAWRAESWEPDEYSIVRFKLTAADSGTRIVFDHMGFPSNEADHLAAGWYDNYWRPMAKVLN